MTSLGVMVWAIRPQACGHPRTIQCWYPKRAVGQTIPVRRQRSLDRPGGLKESFWLIVTFTGAKMRQQTRASKEPAEKVVQDIRREDPDRSGTPVRRGQHCRAVLPRGDRAEPVRWSKDFLEAGKKRLAGDTARAVTSDEVHDLRREAMALKEVVADLTL